MLTPWDTMNFDPSEVLSIASQSSGAHVLESSLRGTYRDAFMVKSLEKVLIKCASLFPQDGRVCTLPRLESIFEETGCIEDSSQQHQYGQHRKWTSPRIWKQRLEKCGVDVTLLTGQVLKMWESPQPSTAASTRERSRGSTTWGTQGGQGSYRSWW